MLNGGFWFEGNFLKGGLLWFGKCFWLFLCIILELFGLLSGCFEFGLLNWGFELGGWLNGGLELGGLLINGFDIGGLLNIGLEFGVLLKGCLFIECGLLWLGLWIL